MGEGCVIFASHHVRIQHTVCDMDIFSGVNATSQQPNRVSVFRNVSLLNTN